MEIWSFITGFIIQSIAFLTTEVGVSEALAIILFTLLARLVLMPINIVAMINMYRNKKLISAISPQLEQLKVTYEDQPSKIAKQTMGLYRKHNIKILAKSNIANMTSQGIFGVAMFQALQQMLFSGKFAWIVNIAKPDVVLALLVGAITYFSMIMMPNSAEQTSTLLFIIPAIITIIALINFPSAIGLYWATSSGAGLVQSLVLKAYLKKQEKYQIV